MKKLISILMVLLLIVAFVGCSKNEEPTTEAPATEMPSTLVDGTYTASYSHYDSRGWVPVLTLEIKEGKISLAMMDYVNGSDGHFKSEDEEYSKNMSAKTNVTPKDAYDQLNQVLVDTQDISKVDAVAGATHSSEYFHEMVSGILLKAASGDTSNLVLPMNATYSSSEADFDERGWKATVSVTYENGKITSVMYDYVDKDGNKKRDNEEYNKSMKEVSGVSSLEASQALEASLVNSQNPEKIDVVTGATSSSTKFIELAKNAIESRMEYNK
jgi:major membrane immunogen (membrane-anchored lipoprotein)